MTNMTNYINFVKAFEQYKLNKSIDPNSVEDSGVSGEEFIENYDTSIPLCKVFEIGDDIKRLLLLTKTPSLDDGEQINLPFDYIFLDIAFTRAELEQAGIDIPKKDTFKSIQGIMFSKGHLYAEKDIDNPNKLPVGNNLRVSAMMTYDDNSIEFNTMNRILWVKDEKMVAIGNERISSKIKKSLGDFVINFVHFLNNPEIEYLARVRDELSNAKRVKRGKMSLPSSDLIRVTGELKRYVDNIASEVHDSFSHRFWVRGHFRTLKNPRFKKNVGKRKWILPYIKGKGILIEKTYSVK